MHSTWNLQTVFASLRNQGHFPCAAALISLERGQQQFSPFQHPWPRVYYNCVWYIYIYVTYIHLKILFTNILCFSKHPELLVRHLEMPHIRPTGKYQRWHINDKFFIIFSQASFNKNFLQEQYKTFWTFYYNPLNKSPRKYLLYHALCPSLSLGNLCVVHCALRLKEGNHFKFHTWYCWASALQKMWGWGPSHLFKGST